MKDNKQLVDHVLHLLRQPEKVNQEWIAYRTEDLYRFYKHELKRKYTRWTNNIVKNLRDAHSPLFVIRTETIEYSELGQPMIQEYMGYPVNRNSFDNLSLDPSDNMDRTLIELKKIAQKYSTTVNNDSDGRIGDEAEGIYYDITEAKGSLKHSSSLPKNLVF